MPANRFQREFVEDDFEQVERDEAFFEALRGVRTEYLPDDSQSIVTENESPDVSFRYSINPYRGCSHGCSYCYARPTHEYLGLNAGIDFETKILVKERAPELFRRWLCRPNWRCETIAFSGVTDCYQPAERRYQLTRRCLQVALEARQPVSITTKNALVTRDLDILRQMAALRLVHVGLSITTLDPDLTAAMEPRTSRPAARLRAVEQLTRAGVPAHIIMAPLIPGLNDDQIPAVLRAAASAGAHSAGYILLRLPGPVQPVFLDWLDRELPDRKARILSRIRAARCGHLNDWQFHRRMRGEGELAEQIARTFALFAKQYGLDRRLPPLDTSRFRPPRDPAGQMWLF